jgi:hypothetical protein
MYLRYALHVGAYASLAADPFPGFLGQTRYPVDLAIPRPADQSRWSIGFRAVLALPPFLLAGALGSGMVTSAGMTWLAGAGAFYVAGFLAWFAILARGRMPAGLRDVLVWTLGYAVQTAAYFFLVTGAFPDSDPRAVPLARRPRHPVRLANADDPRRSRLTTAFRAVLVTPHYIWLTLWSAVILVGLLPAWLAALVLGRLPRPLHRFTAAFVRYTTHVTAYSYLTANLFPGFTGKPGVYPVDLALDPPARQSRWTIGFRWLLAFPALILQSALTTALLAGAVGAWFAALVTGRMPRGLQHLGAYVIRYSAQTFAYALLLTPVYPHSGPSEEERPADPFLAEPERPAALELAA